MKKFSFPAIRPLATGLAFSALTFVVVAHAALSSVGAGQSEFLAVGPAGLKIQGTGSGVSVKESGGKVTVTAPVNNLKTGISLRDSHLKDAINAKSHPNATLVVERSKLKFPKAGATQDGKATGSFTLNGVSKTVPFSYRAKQSGGTYEVQGHTTIKITDYKLEQPCYLGVCVDKEVKVKVKFKVKD